MTWSFEAFLRSSNDENMSGESFVSCSNRFLGCLAEGLGIDISWLMDENRLGFRGQHDDLDGFKGMGPWEHYSNEGWRLLGLVSWSLCCQARFLCFGLKNMNTSKHSNINLESPSILHQFMFQTK